MISSDIVTPPTCSAFRDTSAPLHKGAVRPQKREREKPWCQPHYRVCGFPPYHPHTLPVSIEAKTSQKWINRMRRGKGILSLSLPVSPVLEFWNCISNSVGNIACRKPTKFHRHDSIILKNIGCSGQLLQIVFILHCFSFILVLLRWISWWKKVESYVIYGKKRNSSSCSFKLENFNNTIFSQYDTGSFFYPTACSKFV